MGGSAYTRVGLYASTYGSIENCQQRKLWFFWFDISFVNMIYDWTSVFIVKSYKRGERLIRKGKITLWWMIYFSGSQLGVRQKSLGIRRIFVNLRFTLWKWQKSLFTREFNFFYLGVREQKKVGNRWCTGIVTAFTVAVALNYSILHQCIS